MLVIVSCGTLVPRGQVVWCLAAKAIERAKKMRVSNHIESWLRLGLENPTKSNIVVGWHYTGTLVVCMFVLACSQKRTIPTDAQHTRDLVNVLLPTPLLLVAQSNHSPSSKRHPPKNTNGGTGSNATLTFIVVRQTGARRDRKSQTNTITHTRAHTYSPWKPVKSGNNNSYYQALFIIPQIILTRIPESTAQNRTPPYLPSRVCTRTMLAAPHTVPMANFIGVHILGRSRTEYGNAWLWPD